MTPKYYIYDFLKSEFPVSQVYGAQIEYYAFLTKNALAKGHEGVDFATPNGTEIYSPFDGIIVRDTFDPKAYGNYVVVWDPVQLCAVWFCHLMDAVIAIGDKVTKGQLIGHTNNTGNTTGPHCHVNFVETDADGMRQHTDDGEEGFMNILDEALVEWRPFPFPISQPTPDQVNNVQEAPKPPVSPSTNNYVDGIDLNNPESVKAAVDTWQDVANGKYVPVKDVEEIRRQRDDALQKSSEVSQKYTTDLANYSGLVAAGYNDTSSVDKAIKDINDENTGLKEQIVEVKKRNADLANAVSSLEKEDYTAIESGMTWEQKAKDFWSTIVAVAEAHSTKPTLEAILSQVDNLKTQAEKALTMVRKANVKQSIKTAKAPIKPQLAVSKQPAENWLSSLLKF